jgi:hypothetical protein
MTPSRPALSIATLTVLAACGLTRPAGAQASLQPAAAPFVWRTGADSIPALRPTRTAVTSPVLPPRTSSERIRNGVIGGVVGAAVGVGVCTILSVAFFEGNGCTTKGNVAFGAGGFALGFGVGFLL